MSGHFQARLIWGSVARKAAAAYCELVAIGRMHRYRKGKASAPTPPAALHAAPRPWCPNLRYPRCCAGATENYYVDVFMHYQHLIACIQPHDPLSDAGASRDWVATRYLHHSARAQRRAGPPPPQPPPQGCGPGAPCVAPVDTRERRIDARRPSPARGGRDSRQEGTGDREADVFIVHNVGRDDVTDDDTATASDVSSQDGATVGLATVLSAVRLGGASGATADTERSAGGSTGGQNDGYKGACGDGAGPADTGCRGDERFPVDSAGPRTSVVAADAAGPVPSGSTGPCQGAGSGCQGDGGCTFVAGGQAGVQPHGAVEAERHGMPGASVHGVHARGDNGSGAEEQCEGGRERAGSVVRRDLGEGAWRAAEAAALQALRGERMGKLERMSSEQQGRVISAFLRQQMWLGCYMEPPMIGGDVFVAMSVYRLPLAVGGVGEEVAVAAPTLVGAMLMGEGGGVV